MELLGREGNSQSLDSAELFSLAKLSTRLVQNLVWFPRIRIFRGHFVKSNGPFDLAITIQADGFDRLA